MYNYRLLQLFIIFIISIFLNGNAFAFYKPKMVVTEFDDPKIWDKPFSPGRAISNRLENELKNRNKLLDILIENPIILERPIIINNDKGIIGRPPENVYKIL